MSEQQTMTRDAWEQRGRDLWGDDKREWLFECPVCKHVASANDYQRAGAPPGAVAFSCLGRWIEGAKAAFEASGKGPCTYAGGGLFKLNPITITDGDGGPVVGELFAFATREPSP